MDEVIPDITDPTDEGLTVRKLRAPDGKITYQEVGHFAYVIYERFEHFTPDPGDSSFMIGCSGESGVRVLLDRIVDLDECCETMQRQNPVSIDLPLWQRNRKMARRRFRRWVDDNKPTHLELPTELQRLARDILDAAPEKGPDLNRAWDDRNLGRIWDYERRRADAIVILVTELPFYVRSLLSEAREAYFCGLFRAAVALCRALFEAVLKDILQRENVPGGAVPLYGDKLGYLVGCIPRELLKPLGMTWTREICILGNNVLHEGADVDEGDAWQVLDRTSRIVEVLFNRANSLPSKSPAAS